MILVYGMGQTAGNLANDEAPGSTGPDGSVTQPIYGAPLAIAKGTFAGLAPAFNQSLDSANVFTDTTDASTEAATTIDFNTTTLSAPEPGTVGILAVGGVMMMRRRRTQRRKVAAADGQPRGQ